MNRAQSPTCWTPSAPISLRVPNLAKWYAPDTRADVRMKQEEGMVRNNLTEYNKKPRSLGKAANTILAVLQERPWQTFPVLLAECQRRGVSEVAIRRSVLYLFRSGRIGRRGERRHFQYAKVTT